jgi:redox-sensitive bicupin YhaK (pirin superfamily)
MSTQDMIKQRRIVHRTRGRGHGPIVRLMSPSDLGEHLKPFVFLDFFESDMRLMSEGMQIHPHSGLATVTVITDGDVTYDDLEAGHGTIAYGGVEWMRAGGGVWHGKELSAGSSRRVQGFQLWLALPPELENGEVDSQYIEAPAIPSVGPAHVIVGEHGGAVSPVRAPAGINYLLVTLASGEHWTYRPPEGHSLGWLAMAKGSLEAGANLTAGELAIFEDGEEPVTFKAGDSGATFVLGSAIPHPHELHLGHYSVHTSPEALAAGERRIAELGARLRAAGDRRLTSGSTPLFR